MRGFSDTDRLGPKEALCGITHEDHQWGFLCDLPGHALQLLLRRLSTYKRGASHMVFSPHRRLL